MVALDVVLDFTCAICGQYMGVTLRCAGNSLSARPEIPASIKAPCPTCGENNVIHFTTAGTLLRVDPERRVSEALEPSYN